MTTNATPLNTFDNFNELEQSVALMACSIRVTADAIERLKKDPLDRIGTLCSQYLQDVALDKTNEIPIQSIRRSTLENLAEMNGLYPNNRDHHNFSLLHFITGLNRIAESRKVSPEDYVFLFSQKWDQISDNPYTKEQLLLQAIKSLMDNKNIEYAVSLWEKIETQRERDIVSKKIINVFVRGKNYIRALGQIEQIEDPALRKSLKEKYFPLFSPRKFDLAEALGISNTISTIQNLLRFSFS